MLREKFRVQSSIRSCRQVLRERITLLAGAEAASSGPARFPFRASLGPANCSCSSAALASSLSLWSLQVEVVSGDDTYSCYSVGKSLCCIQDAHIIMYIRARLCLARLLRTILAHIQLFHLQWVEQFAKAIGLLSRNKPLSMAQSNKCEQGHMESCLFATPPTNSLIQAVYTDLAITRTLASC